MEAKNYIESLKEFFTNGGTVQEMLENESLKQNYYSLVQSMLDAINNEHIINRLRPVFTLHHSHNVEYPNQHTLVEVLSGNAAGGRLAKKALTEAECNRIVEQWSLFGFEITTIKTQTHQFFFIKK